MGSRISSVIQPRYIPLKGKPGWNLTTAMPMTMPSTGCTALNQIDPSKPFFCYYVPGAHSRATPSNQGMGGQDPRQLHLFDKGWNKLRDTIYRQSEETRRDSAGRQAHTLAEGDLLKEWDHAVTPAEKKLLYIRAG